MPRVNKVERAAKDHPRYGIKKGEPYYWWTFKNQRGPGTKMVSKTYPKPSQLTRSPFKSQWRSFGEQIADLPLDESLHEALQQIAGEIRELGEECQSSLDNMPEGLQQGATGEMLQERIDACEAWASEIEGLDEPSRDDCEQEAEEEHPDPAPFGEWLDDYSISEPQRAEFASEPEEFEAYLESFQEWAETAWEEHGNEVAQATQDREERTEALWDEKLDALKEEALGADPGEV